MTDGKLIPSSRDDNPSDFLGEIDADARARQQMRSE